jgi:hypothetical protein
MNKLKLSLSILLVLSVILYTNSQTENPQNGVCVAANIPELIDEFKNLNFQTKPICEKTMKLVSKFAPENQRRLFAIYNESDVEYCFRSSDFLAILDDDVAADAQILSVDSTDQVQKSRKPAIGCCDACSQQAGTEVVEAVDPTQPCADLAKYIGAALMNLARGFKKNCLLCRELAKGCIFQSIAVLETAFLGGGGCIKFCQPTKEQMTKIQETFTELFTPLDSIDNSIIQSSNDCINKCALMPKCAIDTSLSTIVDATSKLY